MDKSNSKKIKIINNLFCFFIFIIKVVLPYLDFDNKNYPLYLYNKNYLNKNY